MELINLLHLSGELDSIFWDILPIYGNGLKALNSDRYENFDNIDIDDILWL